MAFKQLTDEQFKAVKASGACGDMTKEVFARSYKVLVKGKSCGAVARDLGDVSRQAVLQSCDTIYAAYLASEFPTCPSTFVVFSGCVPKKLASKFRAMEKEALAEYIKKQNSK